jgi:hypothetical protein
MNRMNHALRHSFLALLAGAMTAVAVAAATPPAQKLLPPDTLALLSLPDVAQMQVAQKKSAVGRLWDDPALRPFREKLMNKLQTEVLDKLEKEVGVKAAEYAELVQGQFALALTRNGWNGTADPLPGLVVLLDARDKGDSLKSKLAELRKKLTDAGKTLKSEKIRDVEFSTLPLDFDDPDAPKVNLTFGQVGSVLVAGTSLKDLDRVVGGLTGAGLPTLAEEAAFDGDFQAFFREAQAFGWIHFTPLAEVITKVATAAAGAAGENPMAPKPDKVIAALGFKGLKTLAFGVRDTAEGAFVDMNLNVPAVERRGLLKLLVTEAKDSGIPAFVPADACAFWRWRLSGQKLYGTIEDLVNDISPGMLGFFTAQIDSALKEKDPNFDFKRSFIMNLGDDLISYQKPPKSTAAADLLSQPSLSLIGSPNAEQLLGALRSAVSLLPGPLASMEIKDREFLGRRVYSIEIPNMTGSGSATQLHLAASGGYLGMAGDAATLEEYLRSAESKPKPLADLPGLKAAAEKVGGTSTGLFGFQNDAEAVRMFWDALRTNKDLFLDLVGAQNPALKESLGENDEMRKTITEWLDFALLPPFEQVAKYFHVTVYAGRVSSAGYLLKAYTPMPPTLK